MKRELFRIHERFNQHNPMTERPVNYLDHGHGFTGKILMGTCSCGCLLWITEETGSYYTDKLYGDGAITYAIKAYPDTATNIWGWLKFLRRYIDRCQKENRAVLDMYRNPMRASTDQQILRTYMYSHKGSPGSALIKLRKLLPGICPELNAVNAKAFAAGEPIRSVEEP